MIFAPHSSRRSTWRSSGQISILAGKIKIRMDIHDVSDFKYRRRGIVLNSLVKVYFGSTPITFDLSHHDKTDMSHSSLAFTWDQLAYRGINLFNSSPTQLKPLIEGRHISLLIELLLLQLDVWTSWGAFRKESSSFLCFSCSSVPSRFVSWIYSFVFFQFSIYFIQVSHQDHLVFAFTGQLDAFTWWVEQFAAADQTVTIVALEQLEACWRQLQGSLRVRHKLLQVQQKFSTYVWDFEIEPHPAGFHTAV